MGGTWRGRGRGKDVTLRKEVKEVRRRVGDEREGG
jgi:hypothetical protein